MLILVVKRNHRHCLTLKSEMSTANVETVNTAADKVKLLIAILLVVGGVVGFYVMADKAFALRVALVLGGVLAGVVVFLLSEPGKRFFAFGRESVREAQRVAWPTRKETLQMTGIVFVFVLVMAIFLWATDKTLEWLLYDLILGWKK